MFESVRPPTDNLYKFIAIFGLAILLVSGWSCLQTYSLQERLDRESVGRFRLLAEAIILSVAEADGTFTRPTESEIQRLRDEAYGNVTDRIDAATPLTLAIAGMAIGAGLTIVGFTLWYRKVQRHLDKLLLAQIAKES